MQAVRRVFLGALAMTGLQSAAVFADVANTIQADYQQAQYGAAAVRDKVLTPDTAIDAGATVLGSGAAFLANRNMSGNRKELIAAFKRYQSALKAKDAVPAAEDVPELAADGAPAGEESALGQAHRLAESHNRGRAATLAQAESELKEAKAGLDAALKPKYLVRAFKTGGELNEALATLHLGDQEAEKVLKQIAQKAAGKSVRLVRVGGVLMAVVGAWDTVQVISTPDESHIRFGEGPAVGMEKLAEYWDENGEQIKATARHKLHELAPKYVDESPASSPAPEHAQ